jgi:hypothetical protein
MNAAFLKGNKLVQLTARCVQMRPNLGSDIWNCATANVVSARQEAAKRFAGTTATAARLASQQIPISVSNPPPTQITLAAGWGFWGRVSAI